MIKQLIELNSAPIDAERVGNPFLLDKRKLSDGSRGWQRAGEREIDTRANAMVFIEAVRGTSGVVAQGYKMPSAMGKVVTIETELSDYDLHVLRHLRHYR